MNKRTRDESTIASDNSESSKRLQQSKIHSEIHLHTVELLMSSQRLLQSRKKNQIESVEVKALPDESVESEIVTQYHQSPYWPQLIKIKEGINY